jgi:hypothetical protein
VDAHASDVAVAIIEDGVRRARSSFEVIGAAPEVRQVLGE